jgi:hypothetical protein
MQTWALVFGIVGTVTGLMAGGAAIYSLVISHRALGFEKKKWEESKQRSLRVELRHDVEIQAPDEGQEGIKIVSVVGMYAFNEGAVPVRLTQGWLQFGPDNSPFPIMSEYIAPCMTITVEPNDGKRITYSCGTLAKMAAEKYGYAGTIDINGYFYDSHRRVYRNTEPMKLDIDMFYRDGVAVEDPLSYVKFADCPDCGSQKRLLAVPPLSEIIEMKEQAKKKPPDEEPQQ